MAATKEVYTKKIFYITGDTGITVYLPKALSSYKATSGEASSTTDARFCTEHYCDLVRHYECPDPDDPTSTEYCCAGFLKETPSSTQEQVNQRMHNLHTGSTGDGSINRKGKIRIRVNNVNYFMLNDGGLNTRPYADLCPVLPESGMGQPTPYIWADEFGISFWMIYKNAKYSRTDYIKVRVTIYSAQTGGSQIGQPIDITIPNINTAKDYSVYADSNNPFKADVSISNGNFVHGNWFTMQLLATNEEGTYTSTLDTTRYEIQETQSGIDVWKIPTRDSTREDGVPYKVLLDHEMYRHAASGESVSGTYQYPTIWNVYQKAQLTPEPRVFDTTPILQLRGGPANSSSRPGSTLLDPGMYLGFPVDWTQDATFEDIITYDANRVTYVSGTGMDTGYTATQGVVYQWYKPSVTPPGPPPSIESHIVADSMIAHISGMQSYDSESIPVSTATYDSDHQTAIVTVYPYVRFQGYGTGTASQGTATIEVTITMYVGHDNIRDEIPYASVTTTASSIRTLGTGVNVVVGCSQPGDAQSQDQFAGQQFVINEVQSGASATELLAKIQITGCTPTYNALATVNAGAQMEWNIDLSASNEH